MGSRFQALQVANETPRRLVVENLRESAELSEAADCLSAGCSYTHPLNHPIP